MNDAIRKAAEAKLKLAEERCKLARSLMRYPLCSDQTKAIAKAAEQELHAAQAALEAGSTSRKQRQQRR